MLNQIILAEGNVVRTVYLHKGMKITENDKCFLSKSLKNTWIFKKWSTDTFYHIDEPQKLSKKAIYNRLHVVWSYLYEIARIGKCVVTERWVVG